MWDTLWWMDDDISYEKFMFWVDKLTALAKDYTVVFFVLKKIIKNVIDFAR